MEVQPPMPNDTMPANLPLPEASGHTKGPPESPLQEACPAEPAQTMPSVM